MIRNEIRLTRPPANARASRESESAASARHIDRVVGALHAILMLQAIGHYVELQRTDRPEDEVVADERPENLGRTLLAQLVQSLLQGLHAQQKGLRSEEH